MGMIPALLMTLVEAAVLSGVFAYLYRARREAFLGWWTAALAASVVRHAMSVVGALSGLSGFTMLEQAAALAAQPPAGRGGSPGEHPAKSAIGQQTPPPSTSGTLPSGSVSPPWEEEHPARARTERSASVCRIVMRIRHTQTPGRRYSTSSRPSANSSSMRPPPASCATSKRLPEVRSSGAPSVMPVVASKASTG